MVELLLALPIVLLLGLGVVQWTLVYQAKHALDHALSQAARQGAVDHAFGDSLREGFAAGLVPYLYGATDWASLLQAEARAAGHVEGGAAAGWIRLTQRSPTHESFEDWAEPALDEMGDEIAGTVEIPNDNLDNRRLRMQPASGVAGLHLSEPIGRLSGQTLADANLLRLELVYGVRLAVPLIAPMIVRTLAIWNRCGSADVGDAPRGAAPIAPNTPSTAVDRLGLLAIGPGQAGVADQPWMCGFLSARDAAGRTEPRIPIRASATVRMMSTARRSVSTRSRDRPSSGATSAGPEVMGPGSPGIAVPDPVGGIEPGRNGDGGIGHARDGGATQPPGFTPSAISRPIAPGLNNGFLGIGSDRSYGMPTAHPALCPS